MEAQTRARIALFLPEAIRKALSSYEAFLTDEVEGGSKEFKAHHDAGKVAIGHLELLIKMAKWVDEPSTEENHVDHQAVLSDIIKKAQEEIESFNKSDP